jgi:glycosyltransferase involved in cell wall biosynthesis
VRLLLWATVSERTERRRGFVRERLRPMLLREADGVLVNGASGARYITRQGVPDARVARVPYTADVAAFARPSPERPRHTVVSLLYVGLLIPRKGVLGFLRALAAWTAMHPQHPVEFRIAGEGPERAALEAVTCPPTLNVHFLGHVAYEQLPEVYAQSSMLTLPTLEDEWGVVVNEAMAAGLPVLGSRFSQAVEELVTDGETGWTFVPDDHRSVWSALDAAIAAPADERARMGRQASERARAITPQKVAHDIANAIGCVLATQPQPGVGAVAGHAHE